MQHIESIIHSRFFNWIKVLRERATLKISTSRPGPRSDFCLIAPVFACGPEYAENGGRRAREILSNDALAIHGCSSPRERCLSVRPLQRCDEPRQIVAYDVPQNVEVNRIVAMNQPIPQGDTSLATGISGNRMRSAVGTRPAASPTISSNRTSERFSWRSVLSSPRVLPLAIATASRA